MEQELDSIAVNNLSEEDRAALVEFYNAASKRSEKFFKDCSNKIVHAIVVSKRRASRANKPKVRR